VHLLVPVPVVALVLYAVSCMALRKVMYYHGIEIDEVRHVCFWVV
jgi:hypothetical protein